MLSTGAFAQTSLKIVSNRPLLLNHQLIKPAELEKKTLTIKDELESDGTPVRLQVRYDGQTFPQVIHPHKMIRIKDILLSTYPKMEDEHGLKATLISLWVFCIRTDESPVEYHKRYLREVGGPSKGSDEDLLNQDAFNAELSHQDSLALRHLQTTSHGDSLKYYLGSAVYLEERRFLNLAGKSYRLAYIYQQKKQPSPLVVQVYKQFLYRIGEIKAGHAIQ
jgi:hypothetical protein